MTRRIVGQRDDDIGVARRGAQHLRRHIEHGVPAGIARDGVDHLPGLHDFAGFRRAAGDRAGHAGLELGVADAVLGDLDLRLGVVDRGLRAAQGLLRLFEIGAGRPALPQQGLLAVEDVGILLEPPLRARQRGARRAKRVQLVLRIEPRHDLVRRDAVTRIHRALDDPSADAEGQGDFLFRLDLSGQDDGLAEAALFDDDRADGARRRLVLRGLALAAGEQQRERRRGQQAAGGRRDATGNGSRKATICDPRIGARAGANEAVQKEPTREPSTITTASAMIAPRIATMKISL